MTDRHRDRHFPQPHPSPLLLPASRDLHTLTKHRSWMGNNRIKVPLTGFQQHYFCRPEGLKSKKKFHCYILHSGSSIGKLLKKENDAVKEMR